MIKNALLSLTLVFVACAPCMLANNDVVLTPTALYDFITQLQKRTDGIVVRSEALRKRVEAIEPLAGDAHTPGSYLYDKARIDYKISELERKVAGMQKQITVLHAKKVNKQ